MEQNPMLTLKNALGGFLKNKISLKSFFIIKKIELYWMIRLI